MDNTTLLKQAQEAIKKGDKGQARQLLQVAVRQDAQNHRAWLWLASITASPQASLEYVKRAELLRPDDAQVKQALTWAEKRLRDSAGQGKVEERVRHNGLKMAGRLGVAFLLVLVVGAFGFLLWQSWFGGLGETAVIPEAQGDLAAVLVATATPEPALPTVTPSATAVAIQPKNMIAASDNPRATWTLTPTPTRTPTPTNTVPPTFVSEAGGSTVRGRPLGVAPNERWIDVNLTTQTLVAYEGNEPIFETLISSGTWEHPTVTGQFRIWLRYESQTMDGRLLGYDYYLENVPYVMYFYRDYALHGTFWHSNFGTPMSHGCVNLKTSDAQWIFSWAGIGTVVNVHY